MAPTRKSITVLKIDLINILFLYLHFIGWETETQRVICQFNQCGPRTRISDSEPASIFFFPLAARNFRMTEMYIHNLSALAENLKCLLPGVSLLQYSGGSSFWGKRNTRHTEAQPWSKGRGEFKYRRVYTLQTALWLHINSLWFLQLYQNFQNVEKEGSNQ